MTELYKTTYAYDTDKEDELSLKLGETVRVSNKENADWWLAERLDNNKEFGLVPSNFLEKIPVTEGIVLAIVTKDYLAQDPEELSLQKNRIVTVLDQHIAEGWWKGDLNGKIGVFPADHVDLVEEGELPTEGDSKSKKDAFKLAAYGVKQGGIGSILAGGFSLKRSSTRNSMSAERPTSTNSTSSHSEVSAPSIPNKPHPSLIKTTDSTSPAAATKKSDNPMSSRAMVLHDYNPENNDEIKLMRGEYVTVVDQLDNDGWWKGTSESGATGVFPSNFVQILEEDKPPQRPARARPATVKTEAPASTTTTPSESTSMVKPPPVPVTTRPMSLLSQRDSTSSTNSSVASPPPRPTTTPPRPITSPPVATRRTNSIVSPPSLDIGHRRIPSIPVQSPDLPPMSPVHERPTRPIPRPTSTNSGESFGVISPSSSTNINQNAINHMAKPPKVNFGTKATPTNTVTGNSVPPPRSPSIPGSAPGSRPVSTNEELNRRSINSSSGDTLPKVPKRSMPPLPERGIVPNNFDQNADAAIASRSSPSPPPPIAEKPSRTSHPNIALPSTPVDPMEEKIRYLIQLETLKIRQEFESRLEDERIERLRLQVELEELKSRLA